MSGRLAKAGVISLLGGGAGSLLGLVLAGVVGRTLGSAGAGYFFQLVAVMLILANVLELGADTGLVRELSRQVSLHRFADLRRTVAIAVLPVAAVAVVVVTGLWLATPALAAAISSPDATATVRTLLEHTLPLVVPACLVTVLLGGTRGLGGVLPFTLIYNVGLPLARVLGVLAVTAAGFGLLAAGQAWAWPFLGAAAAAGLILLHQLGRALATAGPAGSTRLPPTPTGALAREFWSFSAPRGVAAGLEIALVWADVLIVGALLGPAAAGIYAVVSRCAQAGLLVENAMRMAVSPRISAAIATGDLPQARALHLTATRSMLLLAWPGYLTLALFAPVVLDLFGSGFRDGTPALAVLCGAMLLWTGAGMVQTVLLMGGRSHWQLGNKALALAVNIAGNLALVPVWGITGAALVWAVTIAVDVGLASWQVHRLMAVRVSTRGLALPVLIVAATVALPGVLALVVFGSTVSGLALHLVIAVPAFLATCWRLRTRLGIPRPAALLRSASA